MYQRRVGGYSLFLSLQPHPGALYRFSQTVNPRQQRSKYWQLADKARKMKEKLKKVTGHSKSRNHRAGRWGPKTSL